MITMRKQARFPFFILLWQQRIMIISRHLTLLLVISLLFPAMRQAGAASVPPGFSDTQIATGLHGPTSMTVLPDGRVLVLQQNGELRIIKDDVLLPDAFYTVQNVDDFAERGCLGITRDPDFALNHFVYLYCTIKKGADSFNSVLRITEANDRAVAGSEQAILTLPKVPDGTQWHMGGGLRFGPDKKLYVAVGGHEDNRLPAESSNSQNLSNPFGKILRVNADGSVPADNPFVGQSGVYAYIFAYGLRNPFSIDIQPGTGLMYIDDVGAGSWEEIDQGKPAANYGWPAVEGDSDDKRYTNAVYAYSHSEGCAITAGVFYDPPARQFPETYLDKYFFADFCDGSIRFIDPANPDKASGFASDIDNPVNIEIAPDGSMLYLARNQHEDASDNSGAVGRISFTNTQTPRITAQPQAQTVFLGDPVTFSVRIDGADRIQWQRNGVDIPGATTASYTLASTTQADNRASFTAMASNAFGTVQSTPALLSITTNHFPQAAITSPPPDSSFAPGETIPYAGGGTDAEDGALPPAAYTWQVDFMHDTHSHPFMAATSGASSGTLTVPAFEADMANTWFRISLTVTDSVGQKNTATRDVFPRMQLGDMTPAVSSGLVEKNKAEGGGPLTLGRIPYPKGMGVHAPSELRYTLGGACAGNFMTDVGVDDSAGAEGSAVFQVWLDGAKVFDSGLLHRGDPRKAVQVSVAGKQELRLVVTDGGDTNAADRADWAGARVTGCPAQP